MYFNRFSLLIWCTLLVLVSTQTVPLSPCPRIFWYENDGQTWFGIIEMSPPYHKNFVLKVEMDIGINLPSSYAGRIELLGQRSQLLVNILNGRKIKYQVHFPVLDTLPVITKITFNDKVICIGGHLTSRVVTSINLRHVLNTNLDDNDNVSKQTDDALEPTTQFPSKAAQYSNDNPSREMTSSKFRPKSSTQISQQQKNQQEDRPNPDNFAFFSKKPITVVETSNVRDLSEVSSVCGVPRNVNPLIIGGDSTRKGDWPWLVAIFVKKVSSLNFICGATLISKNTIVTAAHCLLEKNNRPVRKEEIIVKLGMFDLQDWTDEDTKTMAVRQIISHPSYDGGLGLRNDIALLKVDKVSFTNYILPSCLWSASYVSNSYIGKYGVTVGWGRDEKGLLASPEPRMVRQKLASLDECRESNAAFVFLTSNTTFCAGNRDGTGPCNGDSGGGMFLFIDGKWRLKGIVSSSLIDPSSLSVCDLSYYVIYTDVEKYLDWIKMHS